MNDCPMLVSFLFFFLMIRRPPRSTLFSLHDALPISISPRSPRSRGRSRTFRKRRAPSTSRKRRSRSEEHTSELQSRRDLVCRLLLEKKKKREKPGHKETKKDTS